MRDTVRLEELVCVVNDKVVLNKDPSKPYLGLEHIPSRKACIAGFAPSTESISTNSVFTKGDVLFGKLRPNLRKAVLAPFDGYCSTDILVLRPRDNTSSGFAGRVFQSEKVGAAAERTAVGTKMPRTSWKHLKQEMVFAPPFQEQQLVAQILDTVDTQIRETEALIAKLEHIKQGLLTDLLTRGIDQDGQLRRTPDEVPQLYKDSPLGLIPMEWGFVYGRDVLRLASGKSRTKEAVRTSHGDFPVYGGNGINGYTNQYLVDQPTIVIGRVGENCGAVCVTSGPAWITDNALFGKILSDGVHLDFLYRYFEWTDLRKLQVATGQPLVTQAVVGEQQLPLPPYEEQQRISELIRNHESRVTRETLLLGKLSASKAGLMDDLLTGRVRVTPLLEATERARA